MKTIELTVTRVGNSRGVRLPADVLRRYRIGNILIMEQRPDEIALRPKRSRRQKLDWAETNQQMAQAGEDWSGWESLPEGLNAAPGEAGQRKRNNTHLAGLAPVQGREAGHTRAVFVVSNDL